MNRAKTHGTKEQFDIVVKDLKQVGHQSIWVSRDGLTVVELIYVDHLDYVWLVKNVVKGKSLTSSGYQMIYTRSGCMLVHRLVASAWLGVNNKLEIDHINGDKTDNRVENLRYVTHSENMKAAYQNNLISNPTYFGRYNRKTKIFTTLGHTSMHLEPEEYVAWRINRDLPIKGWMKEYVKAARELLK